jgi:hypothetical protein
MPIGEITNDGKFEIPKVFFRVIEKMIPEINEIEVKTIESVSMISAMTLCVEEQFRVNVAIQIKRGGRITGNLSDYSDKLNNFFNQTYGGDYNFVKFWVLTIQQECELSNRDKFLDLFCKQPSE